MKIPLFFFLTLRDISQKSACFEGKSNNLDKQTAKSNLYIHVSHSPSSHVTSYQELLTHKLTLSMQLT